MNISEIIGKSIGTMGPTRLDLTDDDIFKMVSQFMFKFTATKGVDAEDITIKITEDTLISYDTTDLYNESIEFTDLMEGGNKFFDILYFMRFRSDPDKREKMNVVAIQECDQIISIKDYGRGLMLLYYNLVTQANYKLNATNLPAILTKSFDIDNEAKLNSYLSTLTSFNLEKLPSSWIQKVSWSDIGDVLRNRFSMGIAGHRLIAAIATTTPTNPLTKQEKITFNIIVGLHNISPSWHIHPLTKNNTCTRLRNLAKSLTDYILSIYTPTEVSQMKADKKVFTNFEAGGRSSEWKSWSATDFNMLQGPIGINRNYQDGGTYINPTDDLGITLRITASNTNTSVLGS